MTKVIFPIVSIIVFNSIAFCVPKRMTKIEIYANTFFTMCLQLTTDIILDLRFDLYRMLQKGPDLWPLLIFYGIYPAYSFIFLNFFPYNKLLRYKVIYVFLHTFFVTLFEWLSLKFGTFSHNSWKLWYSSLCDISIFIILASNLSLIRRLIKTNYIRCI